MFLQKAECEFKWSMKSRNGSGWWLLVGLEVWEAMVAICSLIHGGSFIVGVKQPPVEKKERHSWSKTFLKALLKFNIKYYHFQVFIGCKHTDLGFILALDKCKSPTRGSQANKKDYCVRFCRLRHILKYLFRPSSDIVELNGSKFLCLHFFFKH